jgi:hypothetical protein
MMQDKVQKSRTAKPEMPLRHAVQGVADSLQGKNFESAQTFKLKVT